MHSSACVERTLTSTSRKAATVCLSESVGQQALWVLAEPLCRYECCVAGGRKAVMDSHLILYEILCVLSMSIEYYRQLFDVYA